MKLIVLASINAAIAWAPVSIIAEFIVISESQ